MCCPHWGQANFMSGMGVSRPAIGGGWKGFHDMGKHPPFTTGPDGVVKEITSSILGPLSDPETMGVGCAPANESPFGG
jgi:hypothetical protein